MVTQFSEDMFRDDSSSSNMSPQKKSVESQKGNIYFNRIIFNKRFIVLIIFFSCLADNLRQMAEKLREEISEIRSMKQSQENELATIENAALRQRFRAALEKLEAKEQEKRNEVILFLLVFNFYVL